MAYRHQSRLAARQTPAAPVNTPRVFISNKNIINHSERQAEGHTDPTENNALILSSVAPLREGGPTKFCW